MDKTGHRRSNMKEEKTWIVCDDCDGSGLDPEVGRLREDQYVFYCMKCSGAGGWWDETTDCDDIHS